MATLRLETILAPPRVDPMFIIDGNGDSLVNGNNNDIGDGKHFYCAKCMFVVACACTRSRFTMCDHEFCSRCVAMKLHQNVARIQCTGESSTASEKYRGVTTLQPETVQVSSRIGPLFITDGNEDSPKDDISDGKRFYCAKCMHVVPCACTRYNFTMCDHNFCSRCVAVKLRQNVARVKCTGESSTALEKYRGVAMLRPETVLVSPRIDPMSITNGHENSPVDDISDRKHFYCARCMHVVPCACIRYSFTTCDHGLCTRCVAVKLCQNVARAKYTGESSTVSEKYGGGAILQPETVLVPSRIGPMIITHGNEDSPVDDISKIDGGKHFYCAKCMHVVPCACIRSSFRTCDHDFCSSCIAVKLRQNVARVGYSDCEDDDRDLFYCTICMEMVPSTLKFSVNSCGHAFCSSCVIQYVAAKLDNNVADIECPDPGCTGGVVELERCHGIIPTHLLDKWGFKLCESALGTKRCTAHTKNVRRLCLLTVRRRLRLRRQSARTATGFSVPSALCHGMAASRAMSSRSSDRTSADRRTSCSGVSLAGRGGSGAPSARCTWRNQKGAITSNAGVDTASATDAHPSCPRKTITATSASANDLSSC